MPVVVATEDAAYVAYFQPDPPGCDAAEERMALLCYAGCYATYLGPPNDEAFEGHPLAGRGLESYGAFRVVRSSWIRSLERMNRVHPAHDPAPFDRMMHYILAFHDSTFECVADGFEVLLESAPRQEVLEKVTAVM
jgi:hypothetical protein